MTEKVLSVMILHVHTHVLERVRKHSSMRLIEAATHSEHMCHTVRTQSGEWRTGGAKRTQVDTIFNAISWKHLLVVHPTSLSVSAC